MPVRPVRRRFSVTACVTADRVTAVFSLLPLQPGTVKRHSGRHLSGQVARQVDTENQAAGSELPNSDGALLPRMHDIAHSHGDKLGVACTRPPHIFRREKVYSLLHVATATPGDDNGRLVELKLPNRTLEQRSDRAQPGSIGGRE